MLNFYLFGMFLSGCIFVHDIFFTDLIDEVLENNKGIPHQIIAYGLILSALFVVFLSWIVVISRGHRILMNIFD